MANSAFFRITLLLVHNRKTGSTFPVGIKADKIEKE